MKEDLRRIRSKSASSLPDVRLAVIGGASVGKSAISVRFLTKRFIGEYQRNVENIYRRHLEFGNNFIEYDLRDTASILDRLSIINWSTCIAVVYSITDRQSFDAAMIILDEINALLSVTEQHRLKPCITLIANKKDLHHLREVSNDEGQNLANRYKISFAEVSASEDYASTYTPLNSLIVESYLSVLTTRNKDTKRFSVEMKSRTSSEILSSTTSQRSSRSSLDSDLSEFDYRVFGVKYQEDDTTNMNNINNNNNTKEVLRKRKTSVTERKLETLDETTKSFEKIDLVTEEVEENNNSIFCSLEVPDGGDENFKRRSNSYSKKDKKRASLRKSTASKNQGMKKSRSYSDLKSFENEQKWEKSKSNQSLNRLEDMTKEASSGKFKTDLFGLTQSLLEASRKAESSSFTKIASLMQKENSKPGWGKIRKDKKKIASMNTNKDGNESDRGGNNNNNNNTTANNNNNASKFKRGENKSVRRKLSQISAMFKPKIVIESVQ